jgi:hypothetical protein
MLAGSSAPEPGAAELQMACENIQERFAFVGAVEVFGRCLQALGPLFAWSYIPSLALNAGKYDCSILPSSASKDFREVNEWDIRLYEWLINKYLPRRL